MQRLGAARTTTTIAARSRRATDVDLARTLRGESIADGVILVESRLPLAHRHGHLPFARIDRAPLHFIAGGDEPARDRLLFIDTETTGLAGGTGTVAFLLGLARIENDAVVARQYFLSAFRGERAMLEHALDWLAPDRRLVSFNGKCFDAPLLATRYQLALRRNPLAGLAHIDLLHPARAAFRRNWPDCRLQTAEQMLLRLYRTDDVPGHLIPHIWAAWLQHGDTASLPGVVEHNRIDLLSLVALTAVIGDAYGAPGCEGIDALGIARAHRRAGDDASARRHLEEAATPLGDDGALELAGLYARGGEWERALPVLEALAARNVYRAMERLAIYHEHRAHDVAGALAWTERMVRAGGPSDASLARRRARLLRRIEASAGRSPARIDSGR